MTINDLRLSRDKFEFQMLLGVDEQLRRLIIKDGYKLRVYVPYGKQWYEYSIRRLQENPKIAGYVIKNFFALKKWDRHLVQRLLIIIFNR